MIGSILKFSAIIKLAFIFLIFNFASAVSAKEEPILVLPMPIDAQWPAVKVLVNGKPARLVYDSGASKLVLFEQSFPSLKKQENGIERTNVFGGNQKADLQKTNSVTLSYVGLDVKAEYVSLSDYSKTGFSDSGAPFFEGVQPPLKISDDKGERVLIFDAPNRAIKYLDAYATPAFENASKFPLTRKGPDWHVKLPVRLGKETEIRTLDFVVDTGAADGMIITQKVQARVSKQAGYSGQRTGIGGTSDTVYAGRTQVSLGEKSVLIDTTVIEALPFEGDTDGLIGWGFLRRFRSGFDFENGYMWLDHSDADFKDDKIRKPQYSMGGVPMPDWNGMKITLNGRWSAAGLKIGDVLVSVDGVRLSSRVMYSELRDSSDNPVICWYESDANNEICAKVPKGDD